MRGSMGFRYPALLLGVAVAVLSGCSDFFHDPSSPDSAALTVSTAWAPVDGGPQMAATLAEAFDRTNRVRVRVEALNPTELLFSNEVAVTPTTEGIQLALDVPLGERDRVTARVLVTLLEGSSVLFEGSFQTELIRGREAAGEVALTPRPARAEVTGPELITTLRRTVQLRAGLLMATGTPLVGGTFTWSSLDPARASVSGTGVVTALTEGDARIVATSAEGLADTAAVRIAAVVVSVAVAPTSATIDVGKTQPFSAIASDSGGTALTRAIAWSTSPPAIAGISGSGVATGLTPGAAQVRATASGVTGFANLTVLQPRPVVTTGVAIPQAESAALRGTVNPIGAATSASFEYSTNSGLSGAVSTPQVQVGAGSVGLNFEQGVTGLSPDTRYFFRAVAANSGGESRGEILSFTTQSVPVASVTVTPSAPEIAIGGTVALTATVRDARGNVLARPVEWSSAAPGVATVSASGVATGVTAGTVLIRASSGGVTGSASLTVRSPLPTVVTGAATLTSNQQLRLSGTVNPQGQFTRAWFQWGTQPSLTSFQLTSDAVVGSGFEPVSFSRILSEYPTGGRVYYRIVAASPVGEVFGQIRSIDLSATSPPNIPLEFGYSMVFEGGFIVSLFWADNSDNELEFRLERAINEAETFTQIAVLPANTQSYEDVVGSAFLIRYRLRACNAAGCSAFTEIVIDF